MELIRELLSIIHPEDILLEDFGNLKYIEKKFQPLLHRMQITINDKQKIRAAREAGKQLASYERGMNRRIAQNNIGENSTIKTIKMKVAADAKRMLDEKDWSCLLFKENNQQLVFVVKAMGNGFSKYGHSTQVIKYSVSIDFDALRDAFPEFNEQINTDSEGEVVTKYRTGGTRGSYQHTNPHKLEKLGFASTTGIKSRIDVEIKEVLNILVYVMGLYRAIKKEATVDVIGVDEPRMVKAAERAKLRRGALPDIRNDELRKEFEKDAKSAFKIRLDKYKSDKTPNINTIDDMLHTIIEKGYVDKIKINNITYDYYDDRINFSYMRTGKNSFASDSNYITYKINSETAEYKQKSEEYNELRQRFWEKVKTRKAEGGSDEMTTEEEEELLKLKLPTEIKIYLKLDGGKIVPARIEFVKGYW